MPINEKVKQEAEVKQEPMEKREPEAVRKETIRLFKDNDRYKNDLYVSVNGHSFLIQRGVDVEVPYYIAEVIRNSMKADDEALQFMEEVKKRQATE